MNMGGGITIGSGNGRTQILDDEEDDKEADDDDGFTSFMTRVNISSIIFFSFIFFFIG
jgi:hypothetical protein